MDPVEGLAADDAYRIEAPAARTALAVVLVILRVLLVIGGSLALFVFMFVGYLTLPALVLSGFLVLYAIAEVIVRRPWRRQVRIG